MALFLTVPGAYNMSLLTVVLYLDGLHSTSTSTSPCGWTGSYWRCTRNSLYLGGLGLLLSDPLDDEGDIGLLLGPGLPDLQDEGGGTQHLTQPSSSTKRPKVFFLGFRCMGLTKLLQSSTVYICDVKFSQIEGNGGKVYHNELSNSVIC